MTNNNCKIHGYGIAITGMHFFIHEMIFNNMKNQQQTGDKLNILIEIVK